MEENFAADKPISEEKEDKFQRYNFSKRIAETIYNRTSNESIVIGLYGAWGEGKTSVLNFIKKELTPHYPNIIQFSFNPWRFTDEASLLTSFFNLLASELRRSEEADNKVKEEEKKSTSKLVEIVKSGWEKRKGLLKTNKEVVGDLLQQYGKYASIFSVGKSAVDIGKAISNVNIEKLKERIESHLRDKKKRIVVFIDDIDRLDKNEIHSIFRLVKLTGDFAYVTYLLSFDENIVSSSIGDRFGEGDQKAGFNFLEKIVQIPLKIPLAQKSALKDYCFQLIDQSLTASKITLADEEAQEFVNKFTSNYLIRLNTPRLAVRYGNALSFSLPLLKAEVNYVDLLLIEGIRVFYPELYDFVKNQPNYFIGSYKEDNTYSNSPDEKVEKFKKLFDEFTCNYSPDEKDSAKGALLNLFPNLQKVWGRNWLLSGDSYESRYNEKRISTQQYFNRYFSLTVVKGDISDVTFTTFLEEISDGEYTEKIEPTKKLLLSTTPETFIEKLRFREKKFDEKTSTALIRVLSQLSEYFPNKGGGFLSLTTSYSQLGYFISNFIRGTANESIRYELLKWVIENAKSLEFAYEVNSNCRRGKDEEVRLFTNEQYLELASIMINRAKGLSPDKPIWETFPMSSRYMLNVWAKEIDRKSFDEYITTNLEKNVDNLISLLRVFVGFIHSSSNPNPYYGDFTKQAYDWMASIIDVDIISGKMETVLKIPSADIIVYNELEHNQTDENMMKQFAYWHNKNIEEKGKKSVIE